MTAIDFANSFMTWFGAKGGSMSRIQLEAACTITDERSGTEETYYLIAPCRSEHTHSDGCLFSMPNYDFRGIFGKDEHIIIRKHWVSEPAHLDAPAIGVSGSNRESWDEVRLDVRTFANERRLEDNGQIVEATLGNAPLVSRTKLRDEERGLGAVLEYPVKTMNVLKVPMRFQVDTGPLIVPDFDSPAERQVERFDIAYIAFNQFQGGEFILRRPWAVVDGDRPLYSVTDYSVVKVYSGRNEILAGP